MKKPNIKDFFDKGDSVINLDKVVLNYKWSEYARALELYIKKRSLGNNVKEYPIINTIGGYIELFELMKVKIEEAYSDGFSDSRYDFDIENYKLEI